MSSIPRTIAYLALAAALLVAAIAFNDRKYPTQGARRLEFSAAASDHEAELARCKKISPEMMDAACLVVWEANRHRFFRSRKSDRESVTDMPGSRDPVAPIYDAASAARPRSAIDDLPRSSEGRRP
jgi:conjugative transfer region protein TrbK